MIGTRNDCVHFYRMPPKRIAVFRALALGDMLCAVPALRRLRAAVPAARITLVGMPWSREFARRFSRYIDDWMEFPGHPELPEGRCPSSVELPHFYLEARRRRFDWVVQLHGSGRVTNGIARRMGPGMVIGCRVPGTEPSPGLFVDYPDEGHEIHRLMAPLERIGAPSVGDDLEFPVAESDRLELRRLPHHRRWGHVPYVCIHPGARLSSRRWPPEYFSRVADALAEAGYAILLTGSASESTLTAAVREGMRNEAFDLAGQTALGALAALFDGSRLLVCNDTGVSHIAAAVGAPSVVLVMGSDPDRWAPLDRGRHAVVCEPVPCRPCAYDACPIGHPCARAIRPEAVIATALRQLDREFSRGASGIESEPRELAHAPA